MKRLIKIAVMAVVFCFSLQACQKQIQIAQLTVKAFGHGGMGIGRSYPMNSLESVLAALNANADGTEIDIQMTRDGQLVVFRDYYLENQTNLEGEVYAHDLEDLSEAYYTNFPLNEYKVCSLDELLTYANTTQNFVFALDCKFYAPVVTDGYLDSFKNAIVNIVEKHQLHNKVYVESQSEDFLIMMKETSIPLFIYPANFEEGFEIATTHGLYGITIGTDNVTQQDVRLAHEQGIKIATWNTHTKNDNIEAINKGVDYIQTEKLNYLVDLLANAE